MKQRHVIGLALALTVTCRVIPVPVAGGADADLLSATWWHRDRPRS
jgi:hypothetical protein